MKAYLLVGLLSGGLLSCAKEEAIPANSLQMMVQGKQVTFSASAATIALSGKNTQWQLSAQAPDAAKTSIIIGASSAGASMETAGSYAGSTAGNAYGSAGSTYGYLVVADFRNSCGVDIYKNDYITYNTGVIPAGLTTTLPNFTLTIRQVDTGSHTMSGTFSGTYWKGCDKVEITAGQFNLPYTIKP